MTIPVEVFKVLKTLINGGFDSYLVGGCVRDLILGIKPKDWDIATSALPQDILKLFPDAIYENEFGTVRVKTESLDDSLKIIEVTTFRSEGKYSDLRHPDKIEFTKDIKKDLARRDFTINAIALKIKNEILKTKKVLNEIKLKKSDYEFIDPFEGLKDLNLKLIRAVLDPNERFKEDALRLLRAPRFLTQLNSIDSLGIWKIEKNTYEAILKNAHLLNNISKERIRDEFTKIILSSEGSRGILMLEELGLLEYIIPELREGIGIKQNKHHIYTVFEHSIKSLDYACKKNYSLEVRLAALLHDIAKPRTKRGEGENSTFFGHEYLGAKMAQKILQRLCFSREIINKVAHLIRYHMFYYNVGEVTEAGVRRFIKRVGIENIDDLIKVREADRIGSGVPKARVYKMRHLLYMIEKVRRDPISYKMLKINGNDIIKILNIFPGPKIGKILAILLEEVLEDPKKNNKDYLTNRVLELNKLSDGELEKLKQKALSLKEEFEADIENKLKKKYYV
jgi:poly(A) polymerase/tRNA nucleotidyltransferase (CCA-adding enzyme)